MLSFMALQLALPSQGYQQALLGQLTCSRQFTFQSGYMILHGLNYNIQTNYVTSLFDLFSCSR